MAWIKGDNGIVFEVLDSIASGLVGGGHAEYVDAPDEKTAKGAKA
jgi:hypothetical protein